MKYTSLGRTELRVSSIGIGTEHLNGQPRKQVVSVICEAVDRGVNYFDLIFTLPDYLDNMAAAFSGLRNRVFLSAHLGSTERNGQYFKSRSAGGCETFFLQFLTRLGTDHVDVLFLHNFNSTNDWEKAVRPRGVLELAQRLREEGKARYIGISGHYASPIKAAILAGYVDVVMVPINLFNHAMPCRRELLDHCSHENIGLIAMKPFGGGKLLNQRGSLRVPKYQTGGVAYKATLGSQITPAQCLSYAQAQVGVSTALPGVKNGAELDAALQTLHAQEEDKDYSQLLTDFGRYVEGECVYCNHCLPCPEVIDIGQVNRLLDAAEILLTERLRAAYHSLPVKASACTGCAACTQRCPFGVDVVARMRHATALFEQMTAVG